MKKWSVVFVVSLMPVLLSANPIAREIINEFQTSPVDSQRIEFRYFESGYDTISTGFSLLGMQIRTPGNIAVIDTDIYLPGQGYVFIDTSMVSGTLFMPLDSGYITVYDYGSLVDSILYPCFHFLWNDLAIPAPPLDCSAAKFYCWFSDTSFYEYWIATDWYVDSTPTFGERNDDYPGCTVSGTVYGNSTPIPGAELIARIQPYLYVHHPEPFYTQCTTYSQVDGYYSFDSLLPLEYVISASAPGYQTLTQTTDVLRSLRPLIDFDFDLLDIWENSGYGIDPGMSGISVYPNPFSKNLTVNLRIPNSKYQMNVKSQTSIKIYDATGRLVKSFNLPTTYSLLPTSILWSGTDESGKTVSPGIYFVCVPGQKLKVIKL